MKKTIALMLAFFLVMIFPAEAFAGEKVWMKVSYYDSNGNFHEDKWNVNHKGWTDAVEKSMDKNFSDVTVTLMENWYSDIDGQFTPDWINGVGFNWDAIYFPSGCNITVDLNGYCINRNLNEWEYNGEVMYVQGGANVTIKNGDIRGGYSCNGGGGIHMKGGNLTLENVHIFHNYTEDDDGAGIYVDGGNLVMNGGSIYLNTANNEYLPVYGGGIAVYGGTAELNDVEIHDNHAKGGKSDNGGGIAVMGGKLTLNNCVVRNNYTSGSGGAIHANCQGSTLTINNSVIKDNESSVKGGAFYIYHGDIIVNNSNIIGNKAGEQDSTAIYYYEKSFKLTDCYVEGTVIDRNNTLVWENRRDEANNLTGSILREGNGFILIPAAAAIVLAGTGIIIKKKRNSAKAENK